MSGALTASSGNTKLLEARPSWAPALSSLLESYLPVELCEVFSLNQGQKVVHIALYQFTIRHTSTESKFIKQCTKKRMKP